MNTAKRLNTLTFSEYMHLLAHYQRFVDFNSLGLFRPILENEKLTPAQKIEMRDAAILLFPKFFEFLQVKDPATYFSLSTLNQELTVADKHQAWENIIHNQQRIIEAKKLGHRNFGTYSKHECGYDTCPLRGLMVRQGSRLAYGEMRFCSDKGKYTVQEKSRMRKRNRKHHRQLIEQEVENSATTDLS